MQAKQLPEGWKYTTLLNAVGGDPGQVVGGPFGSCLKVEHYLDGGVPIIRLQNIGRRNFIKKDIKYVSQEKADELSYHSYQSGDLILAKLGDPIGKTCIIPEDEKKGIVVSDAVRIRNANENLSSKYLMYVLNSDSISRQLNKQVFGTTRPRVNLEEVRNLLNRYLNEQKQMAKDLRENLKEFRDSLSKGEVQRVKDFQEMIKQILAKQDERKEEVTFRLKKFKREQVVLSSRLKDLLAKGNGLQIRDFKSALKEYKGQMRERFVLQKERIKEIHLSPGELKERRKEAIQDRRTIKMELGRRGTTTSAG